jgi:RNA polymerase sigma factor for flagellar operon FliA
MFSTYANIRVRGAMIDELRKTATISRESMRRRRQFAKARQDLSTSLGRAPSDSEMAERVEMGIGAYQSALDAMQAIEYTSIDDAYSDTSSWFADQAAGADEVLEVNRRRDAIATAIAKLPEREQVILQLFFVDECSLDEIGKIFNVSSTRVCQIKRAALEGLRGDLGKWHED